jgi:hypothetical protein
MATAMDVSRHSKLNGLFGVITAALPWMLLAWWMRAPASGSPFPEFADLSDAVFVEVRTPGGEVAMSGELRDHVDALGNVEKDAALMSAALHRVIGEIEIDIPRPGSAEQQELEVDVMSLEPFSAYHVYINDRLAASFRTDDRGSVDVEFESTPRP